MAEDNELFRRLLSSILQNAPDIQTVGKLSDGLEAVAQAKELQPDLILLDIGLPGINGLEAARRIREVSPMTKILFVTQEASGDVVREAFAIGASGYVVKTDAGSELLPAIGDVLRGERFLSRTAAREVGALSSPKENGVRSQIQRAAFDVPRLHEAVFYSDRISFISTIANFVCSAIHAGDAAVVAVTKAHQEMLVQRLQSSGVDIATLTKEGKYVCMDPTEVLSTFMVNGFPDRSRFMKAMRDVIMTAGATLNADHNCIAVCGECASILLSQGNVRAAIRLEQLWNELATQYRIHGLCGYSLGNFQDEVGSHAYERISAEHSAVYSR
ncbi:MAG TPA: response regulator [Candidatus Binatia bacterium]|nr:response regulator [Candidatus Binatia bacterium]